MKKYNFLKRHIKLSRAITCFVSLFFLISCGIPTLLYLHDGKITDGSYYDFSSEPNANKTEFDTTLSFNIYNSETVNYSYDFEDSPSLCYFYAVCPTDVDPGIVSAFNSKYVTTPYSKRLDTNQEDGNPYVLSVKSGEYNVKLYKFKFNKKLDQLPQNYLLKTNLYDDSNQFGVDQSALFNLSFNELNKNFELTETTSVPIFVSSDSSQTDIILTRYNNDNFINSGISESDLDYIVNDEGAISSNYKVIVYVAMSIEGNFSNLVWSHLHEIGEIEL